MYQDDDEEEGLGQEEKKEVFLQQLLKNIIKIIWIRLYAQVSLGLGSLISWNFAVT